MLVVYNEYLNWAHAQNNQAEKVQCNIIDRDKKTIRDSNILQLFSPQTKWIIISS